MDNKKKQLETLINPCNSCKFLRRWICITGCREYNHYLFELEKLDRTIVGEASLDNYDLDKDNWGYYR